MDPASSSSTEYDDMKFDPPDIFPIESIPLSIPTLSSFPSCSVLKHADTTSGSKDSSTEKRNERPTECSVCGKAANGYHYEVASCNGCKTFFRRTWLSERTFVCLRNQDCFDLKIREFPIKCRACRYSKCINLGMNPLAIQNEEAEDQTENFKKVSKRAIKVEEGDDYVEIVEIKPGPSKTIALAKSITSADEKMDKLIDMLTYLELKVDSFRKCAYNPKSQSLPGLEILLKEQNRITLADKLGQMPGWPLEPPVGLSQTRATSSPNTRMWLVFDLLTAVEYAKTFMFFHQLNMEDRVLLVRNVALAVANLQNSHFSIRNHCDTPIYPDGTRACGKVTSQTVLSIYPLIRYGVSSKEFVLLKAICLCNPAVPGLSHYAQEVISHERQKYASALFEHCIRDSKLGPGHFAHLIGIMDTLEHQQKIQKDIHTLVMLPLAKNNTRTLLIADIMEN